MFQQAAARQDQVIDALIAAQRGLDRVLRGHVGAQAHGGEDFQAFKIAGGVVLGPADDHPARAEASHAVGLGQAIEGQAEYVRGDSGQRFVHGTVVQDLVVNLIGKQDQVVLTGDLGQLLQHRTRVDGAGGVVRVDDNHRPGVGGDLAADVFDIRVPVRLLVAQVVHGLAAREADRSSPQRVVGCRDQHFITVVEQALHGHDNQL